MDNAMRDLDEADVASMRHVPGLGALMQLALGLPVRATTPLLLPPPPPDTAMYGEGESFLVRLLPRRAARLTPRARRALVWVLWNEDFKWTTGTAHSGIATHVHFGYDAMYGSQPHSLAMLRRMQLDPNAVLTYDAGAVRKRERITSIEVPLHGFDNRYIYVRT